MLELAARARVKGNVYYQLIAIGVIIVMAVESDVLRNHLESRMRVKQAGTLG